ncbi:HEPN/Toprim-associated domain-containing protein [Methylocapsa sp. D3K7]|uniref:HEPN/Toprim-associated domain-containing protein n=1 Tax=Methylocapsa sp. D3K7 TaxID=3041435 RepID=UPI00244EAD3D|nr:HEPN/Toprim-associated domain-containing protein [Methylocapsa sp. D3K7]WGJ14700.1 HEPN/Toprim-associated domain-containing protein [Methylocapsa sp. D3K7]
MGSMIHLAVGRLEIDWGKNSGFTDHSPLFQPTDLARVPYYYVNEEGKTYIDSTGQERYELFAELKDGMSKPLAEVIDRIELLGHTLQHCEREFKYLSEFNSFDDQRFTFEELKLALVSIDVNAISADYGEMGEDFGKFFRRQLCDRLGLDAIAKDPGYARYDCSEGMENLSAYSVLRLLALNPKALNLPVTWQFADIENGGWADRRVFVRPLDQSNRFLIVTEGSSDAKIIQHAFKLLKPHIPDFFNFVDMEEGYPFSGTGNLFRFLQGLFSISIRNNVVVIYDNDAEGVANYERSCALNVPANMLILKLPNSPAFAEFDTLGPNGRYKANINGCAAAIECYLDLGAMPLVRWTSFNSRTDTYQGELINKTEYMRSFLDQRERVQGYDYSRIEAVLDMIINNCVHMREAMLDETLDE